MDTCPICFEDLDGKVKASPNNCDHVFCLPCIEKWAKLGSFCPVDRKRFRKIVNLDSESFIQVKPSKRKRRKTVYDFSARCEVCSKGSNANVLLLCDCCDLAFHSFCLNPPLKTVPAGLWFCPTCVSVESRLKKNKGITKELEADLGNAALELKKINESGVKNIDTEDEKPNSDEQINKENDRNKDSSNVNVSSPCSSKSSESNKDMTISKSRSNGICNTYFYQNEVSIEDFTIKNIGTSKKISCAIKSHADSNSPNNCFYFHFCQSNSLKQKVSNCNINETFSLPCKSGDKASLFNSCEQENTSKFGGNVDSNFMLNNFGFSKTSINKDKSCENYLSCVTQSNISCHQNESISDISSTERESETFTRSNHRPLNSDKEISFLSHNDLKYLAIRSDGSFYIDLPKGKNTKTENPHWDVSNKVSDSQENVNFTSNNLKCTDILTGNLTYERENIYQPNTKNECLNSKYVKIQNDRSNSYTSYDKEKSVFQMSGLPDRTDSNTFIHKNDLKYLSIKENGTFSLDLPVPKNIKFEEKTVQKSSMISNSKNLHHTDLKYLSIKEDGTFILDLPVPKNIKFEEKTVQNSSMTSNSKNLHHTDLKHLRIRDDGTFFLDVPN